MVSPWSAIWGASRFIILSAWQGSEKCQPICMRAARENMAPQIEPTILASGGVFGRLLAQLLRCSTNVCLVLQGCLFNGKLRSRQLVDGRRRGQLVCPLELPSSPPPPSSSCNLEVPEKLVEIRPECEFVCSRDSTKPGRYRSSCAKG